MNEHPVIISNIEFTHPSGHGGFSMWRESDTGSGQFHWHKVLLYAWSDGIVTWTDKRDFSK